MRILDLFCGEGIVARGLLEYGEVTGIDKFNQPRYPGKFQLMSWEEFSKTPAEVLRRRFDFIWASPPCQAYTAATKGARNNGTAKDHPDLVGDVRKFLERLGVDYVIENVPGAPLREDLTLCGCMFLLRIERVRRFELSFGARQPRHINHWKLHLSGTRLHTAGHPSTSKAELMREFGLDAGEDVTKAGIIQAIPIQYVRFVLDEYLHWKRTNLKNWSR